MLNDHSSQWTGLKWRWTKISYRFSILVHWTPVYVRYIELHVNMYSYSTQFIFGAARAFELSPVRVRAFATRWRSSGAESRRAAAATARAPAAYKEESLHNPATKYSPSIAALKADSDVCTVYCVRRVYKYSTWAGVRSCACAMSHTVSFDSGCGSWFLQRIEQRTTNPEPCGVANSMQLSRVNRQIDHLAHWPRGCARNRL